MKKFEESKEISSLEAKTEELRDAIKKLKEQQPGNIVEAEDGLESLLGQQVILFGVNFNYGGKLIGVNDKFVLLENGGIIFETGAFDLAKWKDFQKVSDKLYVRTSMIEAYSKGK